MKAVLITADNQSFLASRFYIEEREDWNEELPIGYYLVTDFGNDENFSVITEEILDAEFVLSGEVLDNGFFGVEPL